MHRVKLFFVVMFAAMCWADPAIAQESPEWTIQEVFSSSDGSVQFIELVTTFDGQNVLTGTVLTALVAENDFTFDHDLASTSTAGHSLLLGTTAYAALPGAVAPDFVLPAQFFNFAPDTADTLSYSSSFQLINVDDFTLPLDGVHSLLSDGSNPVNSPTNFAGQTGSIHVWPPRPFNNAAIPLDVNDSGTITPLDALLIINVLNTVGSHVLPDPPTAAEFPPPYVDTDADGIVKPIDALLVINFLNEPSMTNSLAVGAQASSAAGFFAQPALEAPSPQAVPEPAAWILAVSAIIPLLARATQRRREVRRRADA